MDYRSMQDMYFESSLGRVYYKCNKVNGDAVLVLIHGFAASSLSWSRFLQHVPDGISTVAVDLLGHGKSDAPEIEYTISNQTKCISELLASFNGKKIVFGHSYGAWIASMLAMEGRLDAIAVEDAAGLETFTDERLASAPDYKEALVKQALITNPNERVVRSSVYSRTEQEQLTCGKLQRINVPAIIIWGGQDMIVPVKFAHMFNDCIKGSSLFIMPNEKHTPHYTNPAAVAEKVLGLVNDLQR